MSDTTILVDPGTGASTKGVAFDLVGSDYIQKTKTVVGPIGTTQYPQLGSQVSAASLAVVVASDQSAVPVSGTVAISGTVPVSIATTVTVDSELPAAAALADAMSNPTVPAVGSYLMGFNGTTWDRVKTANTGRLQVDVVTGGGGGTQFAEDLPAISGDLGTLALVMRHDADTTTVSADGDYSALHVDASGFLKVNIKAGGGSGGTAQVDRSAFTDGTTTFTPVGGDFNETNTNPTEDQAAVVRITNKRAFHVNLRDASGNEVGLTAAPLVVQSAQSAVPNDGFNNAITLGYFGSFLWGFNGTTWDRLRSTIANGLAVDVTRVTGTVTVDTELTAAVALADATANPTITNIASYLMGFNGATWDRVRTANTGRLQVDVITGGGAPGSNDATGVLGALNAAVTLDTVSTSAVTAQILTGTLVGTVTPEVSNDNATWAAVLFDPPNGGPVATTSSFPFTANIYTAGFRYARLRVSAYTSGTSNAFLHGSSTAGVVRLADGTASIGAVTADTELPAAVALADATANPTAPAVGSFLMGWNGATWDRLKSSTANGLQVDVTRVTGTVTEVGNLTNNNAAPAATNLGVLPAVTSALVPAFTEGNQVLLSSDKSGRARVVNDDFALMRTLLEDISNKLDAINPDPFRPTQNNFGNPVPVAVAAAIGGNAQTFRLLSAATTNLTPVKLAAGVLLGWSLYCTNAAARYIKVYDSVVSPVVGTTKPVETLLVPGASAGAGNNFSIPSGIQFLYGIWIATTTGVADTDTAAVAANDLVINLFYV